MKVERFISYTVQVTSESEKYAVTGNVNVDNMSFTGVSSAFVRGKDSQDRLAEFSWHGRLNVNFLAEMSDEDTCSLIKEVRKYISDAKADAESGVFEAPAVTSEDTNENQFNINK